MANESQNMEYKIFNQYGHLYSQGNKILIQKIQMKKTQKQIYQLNKYIITI
jgi:hypothetical protein